MLLVRRMILYNPCLGNHHLTTYVLNRIFSSLEKYSLYNWKMHKYQLNQFISVRCFSIMSFINSLSSLWKYSYSLDYILFITWYWEIKPCFWTGLLRRSTNLWDFMVLLQDKNCTFCQAFFDFGRSFCMSATLLHSHYSDTAFHSHVCKWCGNRWGAVVWKPHTHLVCSLIS